MIRIVFFLRNAQQMIKCDPQFSDFVDECMTKFKHGKRPCGKFQDIVDFQTWMNSYAYAEYYYPGGHLVVSTSRSNDNTTAEWFPIKD